MFAIVLSIFRLVYWFVIMTCLFTIASVFSETHWLLSLLSHFKIQYILFQSIGVLLSVIFIANGWRNKRIKVINFLLLIFISSCLVLNLQSVMPYYTSPINASTSKKATRPVTLMHINVFAINQRTGDVLEAIKANNPDIVDFVEYTENWQKRVETSNFLKQYPYHASGKAHMAIYSKYRILSSKLFYSDPTRRVANHANLLIKISVDNTPLSVLSVHPPVPAGDKASKENIRAFTLWEKRYQSFGKNLVIIGDFNSTPWSSQFQHLLKNSVLRDSGIGFGVQPTWPMFLAPLGVKTKIQQANTLLQQINVIFQTSLFRIPIDHALVTPSVQVINRITGPGTGSDHLPLTLEITISKQ